MFSGMSSKLTGRARRAAGGGAFAVALTAALMTGSPAHAHEVYLTHGNDYGWLTWNHGDTYACDVENDGNRVRFQIRHTNYTIENGSWDYYGGGCTRFGIMYGMDVRLCEENVGCTAWTRF